MTNTERPTTKAEQKKQARNIPGQKNKDNSEKNKIPEIKDEEKGTSDVLDTKSQEQDKTENAKENKDLIKKQEKPKIKKTIAVVNGYTLPISTKKSIAICKFIKGKRIGDAIRDLEEVVKIKKAVPMNGEIPHRKGRIASGRFPQRTAKIFIILLKSLAGNSNDMDNPVISEAIANMASKPFGRFGRIKRKRTHIKIIAKEKTIKNTKEGKNGRKKNS